eukprot:gene14691-19738_t
MKWFGRWDRSNELELLHKHCFTSRDPISTKRQVELWGPIPQMVLTQPLYYTEDLLNTFIRASRATLLIQALFIDESDKDDTLAHHLIHIITDNEFKQCSRDFGSNFIADGIFESFKKNSSDQLSLFLSDVSYLSNDRIGVLMGRLFERHVINIIANGGEFKIKSLEDEGNSSNIDTTVLNESIIEKFDLTSDVVPNDNILYSTASKSFAAVDFIAKNALSNHFYNATWYRDHSIIMDSADGKSGLYRLINELSSGNKHYQKAPVNNFYFAVPEQAFDTMNKMPLLKWNTSIDPKKEMKIKRLTPQEKHSFQKSVKFFAMCIPIMSKRLK